MRQAGTEKDPQDGHVVLGTKDARCRGATPTALHLEQLTLGLYDAYDRRDFDTPLTNFICPTVCPKLKISMTQD